MLKTISRTQKERIETLLNSMSTEQKIGQTLCPIGWPFGKSIDASTADAIISKMRRYVEQYHVGGLFSGAGTIPGFMALQTALKSMSDIPIIVNGDMETGAGRLIKGKHFFPATMMSGAADSVSMVRTVAEATGIESRECGVHWTLAPVADLCLNRSNPMVFSRAYSCCPEHVTRMATTFIRGVQKNGRLAATAKHFPGDGSEDREPHICTAVLDMTRRQWMESYGKVWKAVIDAGVMSIMTGHIGLPFVDPADSYRGPRPAPLSRKIQLDFLRGELGFDGTIVCDAATMIGFAAHAPARDRAWRAIEAGVDVFLFSNPDIDFPNMLAAVQDGRLSEERLHDAARRVLELKTRVGLFDAHPTETPSAADVATYQKTALEIARRGIVLGRDATGVLPVKLKKGAKVLTVTCMFVEGARHGLADDLPIIDQELKARGYQVDHLFNPWGPDYIPSVPSYDAIFLNFNIPPRYGSTKLMPPMSNPLWEAFWVDHPQVVFTAFGNPFILYEVPSIPNMVLTFCNSEFAQTAAVKAWLGENRIVGKCPVALKGFYTCGVK